MPEVFALTAPRSPRAPVPLHSERDRRILLGLANRIDAGDAGARNNLGVLYFNKGMVREAITQFERALSIDPELEVARNNLEIARQTSSRFAPEPDERLGASAGAGPASREARKRSQATPVEESRVDRPSPVSERFLARYHRGVELRQKGRYEEALQEFEHALAGGEEEMLVRQALAEVHLLKGEFPRAVELYRQLTAELEDSPKLWNELGVCLHQVGELERAERCYRTALSHDPGYALAWNNLAVLQLHQDDARTALTNLQRAAKLQPAFTDARYNQGLLALRSGHAQEALDLFRQARDGSPRTAAVWVGCGMALTELEQYTEARNALARAVELAPDSAEARYNLAFVLTRLGDHTGAFRETRRALELNAYYTAPRFRLSIDLQFEYAEVLAPELERTVRLEEGQMVEPFSFDTAELDSAFRELHVKRAPEPVVPTGADPFQLARDYLTKGLLIRALAEVRRLVVAGIDPVEGALLTGEIFSRQGLEGEALERFDAALSRLSDEPWGRSQSRAGLGRVRALLALGRLDAALETAEWVAENDPDPREALRLQGEILLQQGRALDALRIYARLMNDGPPDPQVLRQVGRAAFAAGKLDTAEGALRRALALEPELAAGWVDLGELLLASDRPAEAGSAAQEALRLLPGFAEAALLLAEAKLQQKDYDGATGALVELLSADTYHIRGLLMLARVLREAQRLTDARLALERVLRFDPRCVEALFELGRIAVAERRFQDALRHWRAAVEIDPESPFARRAARGAKMLLAKRRDAAEEPTPAHSANES